MANSYSKIAKKRPFRRRGKVIRKANHGRRPNNKVRKGKFGLRP